MAEIRTIQVEHAGDAAKRQVQGKLIRVVLDGGGCPLPECNCSNGNYIVLSDGDTLLSAALTDSEAATIRKRGNIDLEIGV